jgi:hypothetical protein
MSAETNNVVIDELGNVLPINENGEVENFHFLDGTVATINKYGYVVKNSSKKVEEYRQVKYSRDAQKQIIVSKFGENRELKNNTTYRVTDIVYAPTQWKEEGLWYTGKPKFALELEGSVRKDIASLTMASILTPGESELRPHEGSFMNSLNEIEAMWNSSEGNSEEKLDEVWAKLHEAHPSMLFRCQVTWLPAMTRNGLGNKPHYTLEWVDDGSVAERNEPLTTVAAEQPAKPKRGRNNH